MKIPVITLVVAVLVSMPCYAGGNNETGIRLDESIKRDVADQLYLNNAIDSSSIEIIVHEGVVTLEGSVGSLVEKSLAEHEAQSVSGVTGVENRITVGGGDQPLPDGADRTVEETLLLDAALGDSSISAKASGDVVTLTGTVDALWKKQRAGELASNVVGADRVSNAIAVVPVRSVLDEDIARKVVAAIDRNPAVDVDAINVEVEAGRVTLTGRVPTWDARIAATEAASYTSGVVDVIDKLDFFPSETTAAEDSATVELVKQQLAGDDRIDASKIRVSLEQGVVTLSGTVPSFYQQQMVTRVVRQVPGVFGIRNELEVPRSANVDDSAIRARIYTNLGSNPKLLNSSIDVTVSGGHVELAGTVPSLYAKLAAEDIASQTIGVNAVENRIAVTPTRTVEDRTIAEQVVASLERRAIVDVDEVDVIVRGGVVTLSGVLGSSDARDAALEAATYIDGVVDVVDDLVVSRRQP